MPYIDFFNINGVPKQFVYSGKYSMYILSKFKKTLCVSLDCRNSTMKFNWCNLDLLLAASTKKQFRVTIDDDGAQVSPIIFLF